MTNERNSQYQVKTPVTFFCFNRPNETQLVFNKIREAKPKRLYLVVDGARNEQEEIKVNQVKEILSQVDWPCEVRKNFAEHNLGCRDRISSAIEWVFSQEKSAIFLEDDCLPSPDFFHYCDDLLIKYEDDQSIGIISGYNPLLAHTKDNQSSIYFSKYPHIWGWASWSRVWKNYDVKMQRYLKNGSEIIKSISHNKREVMFWQRHFDLVSSGKINTWDAQVTYLSFEQSYLNILPSQNLIQNIGFTADATHTLTVLDYQLHKPVQISFPLSIPDDVDLSLDRVRSKLEYTQPTFLQKVARKLKSLFS